MDNDIEKVLLTEEEIKEICKKLGKQITEDYKDKNLILVSILKGSVLFLTDLMREIKCKCKIDFMAVSSYFGGTKSSGSVQFKKDLDTDIKDYDVLIVEDILDSGISLSYISSILMGRHAKSVKICTFLDKPANRKTDIKADYVGAVIPDNFVVGYGLDYEEEYRNLPYLGILKEEVYSK